MKRHWQRNSDNRHLWYTAGLLGVALVGWLVVPTVLSWLGSAVLYPVHATKHWVDTSTQTIPTLWREKAELQAEIESLETELVAQSASAQSLAVLREENRQLRRLLAASSTPRIAATVIGRPSELPYDLLLVDQGTQAGVAVGAPVYSTEYEVIGLVTDAKPRYAQVLLFSTPGFSTTAYLGGANLLVTLEGVGGGMARVAVPQGVLLQEGQLVHLPSIQTGVYGRIVAIERTPTDPQQFGYVSGEQPLQALRYVSIGTPAAVDVSVPAVEAAIAEVVANLNLPEVFIATSTATTSTSTNPL